MSQLLSSRDNPPCRYFPRSIAARHRQAASWVHPPVTYLQLQVFLVSLSEERKARGDVLCWATWLRREGARAETPALSAGRTRTGRRDEAALKLCNTHLLLFFPPQWNRWPGGKRSN